MIQSFWNNNVAPSHPGDVLLGPEDYQEVRDFFGARPELTSTPLLSFPRLAAELKIKELLVKDESCRFGMDSFKIVGVMYAVHKLVSTGRIGRATRFVCATDGNHGRAVSRAARELGLRATVYVPAMLSASRLNSLEKEGAEVIRVAGNYDDAVRQATRCASQCENAILLQDTATEASTEISRWIMAGYTRIMSEVADQWNAESIPDLVVLQVGVGSFACAVASWLCHAYGNSRPMIASCEPHNAACLFQSVQEGHPVTVGGDLFTIMAGLSCGEVSPLAFPTLNNAVDLLITIGDDDCKRAMLALASSDPPLIAGESGAAGLAALLAVNGNASLRATLASRGVGEEARVLVFATEGATDAECYRQIMNETTSYATNKY